MLSIDVQDIKSIKIDKTRHLETDDGDGFYVRHLVIKTDKEVLRINMFADEESQLEIGDR